MHLYFYIHTTDSIIKLLCFNAWVKGINIFQNNVFLSLLKSKRKSIYGIAH